MIDLYEGVLELFVEASRKGYRARRWRVRLHPAPYPPRVIASSADEWRRHHKLPPLPPSPVKWPGW